MKKILFFVFILYGQVFMQGFMDTGFIKWHQPNGIEFIARSWGDEYLNWMKTKDGYMIVDSPEGWYYYAILDKSGEFTASNAKVGIDNPPKISYELRRTSKRISELNNERLQVAQRRYNKRMSLISSGTTTNTTVKLGVVLIDFPTNRRRTEVHGQDGYYKIDFENMIFSTDYWYSKEDKVGNVIYTPHPDSERVFGSLRDYYDEMSVGSYQIVGKNNQPLIVNPPDPNNPDLPEWLILKHEMSYYESLSSAHFMDTIFNEAVVAYGSAEMNSYDVICFLYGGEVRNYGNFRPKQRYNYYCMGEYEHGSFSHIGIHAHEFAHAALGAHDEYRGDPNIDPGCYSLMSYGCRNGPLGHGSCPAPLSPYYRIEYGWVNPITILPDVTSYPIYYGYPMPKFYRVNIPASNEFFILETRRGIGFDKYTPRQDGNNAVGGILIWHFDPDHMFDYEEIEYADNNNIVGWEDSDRFPYPLNSQQNFNNSTIPSSRLRDGTYSSISINNIDWVGLRVDSYGKVDVLDLPPATPTGFTLSGNVGENPTLNWNGNTELDLDGYKLYQSIEGSAYSLLVKLDKNTTSFTDHGVIIGNGKFVQTVCYGLTAFDLANRESDPSLPRCTRASGLNKSIISIVKKKIPKEYKLCDAYPNPFNPVTKIRFSLPENTKVKLSIFNLLGEKLIDLINTYLSKGLYEINFNASGLSSGTYIYRIETNSFIDAKKLLILK